MASLVRWLVAALVLVHGLIHLLGAAKGLDWAEVTASRKPIGLLGGIAWLVAATLVIAAAAALAAGEWWWWLVAAVAAVVSQAVIVTSWSDAKWGTIANIVVLLAAGYGFASGGPVSLHAEWEQRAQAAYAESTGTQTLVTEADLAKLPEPVAAYVRASGAVGKPHITSLYATIHGRIRGGLDQPWMTFTGKQLNTYSASPQRLFFIEASMRGLPVDVLHVFDDGRATMRARVVSAVTIVDAAGADLDRAETVTVFNDLVVLAPAGLVDAPIRWAPINDRRVRGTFTHGTQTVAAELVFNADHELVDFISDDRLRASADGTAFTQQRWSTPIHAYQHLHGRRFAVTGDGRWHAPAPEGEFSYLEFNVDNLVYNTPPDGRTTPRDRPGTGAGIKAGRPPSSNCGDLHVAPPGVRSRSEGRRQRAGEATPTAVDTGPKVPAGVDLRPTRRATCRGVLWARAGRGACLVGDGRSYSWTGAGGPFTLVIPDGVFRPSSTSRVLGSALQVRAARARLQGALFALQQMPARTLGPVTGGRSRGCHGRVRADHPLGTIALRGW